MSKVSRSAEAVLQPSKAKRNTEKINLFFVCFIVWNIVILTFLFFTSRRTSFILINHFRSFFADIFFTIFTDLGSGLALVPLAVLFIYKKNYRVLIGLFISVLLNTLLVCWLKHSFNHLRPLAYYGKHVVETARWIILYQRNSFPSGHTAMAFCIAGYVSFVFRNNKLIILLSFLGACFTAYSRIYLGEHFLYDVWLGSFIGVVASSFSYIALRYLYYKIQKRQNTEELFYK